MENQTFSSASSSTPKPEKLKSLTVAIEESKEKATRNNNLKLGSSQDVTSERRVEIPSFGSGPVRTLSSASSSTPKPKKLKSLTVAIEESKEKATRNNNLKLGSSQDVTSKRRVEIPSFGSGPVRRGSEIPRPSIKLYTCYFCQKWFVDSQEFIDHQNAHKQEEVWEGKRKEMEAGFPGAFAYHYLNKPHILLRGYSEDACFGSGPIMKFYPPQSNNKLYTCHFCQKWFVDSESFLGHQNTHKEAREWGNKPKEMEADFPHLDKPHILLGALSNQNHHGIVPGMTPTRFFTGNTSTNGYPSKGPVPFPSNNNMYPLIPGNVLPFPPPRTSSDLVPQENVLSEENLITKTGMNNDVENDDEDQPEEGKYKRWGMDLSLSL